MQHAFFHSFPQHLVTLRIDFVLLVQRTQRTILYINTVFNNYGKNRQGNEKSAEEDSSFGALLLLYFRQNSLPYYQH